MFFLFFNLYSSVFNIVKLNQKGAIVSKFFKALLVNDTATTKLAKHANDCLFIIIVLNNIDCISASDIVSELLWHEKSAFPYEKSLSLLPKFDENV